jgi:hypothetical protein
MMKKTYKSSLLALSVLASFTSCSESESLQQANLSKDKITFHATLDNSWKPLSPASSSRAAIAAATEKGPIVVSTPFGKPLYLHPVVQDGIHIWSKEGKPITRSGAPLEDVEHERVAQTRGTMSTKIGDYGSFGVTAIYKEGENNVLLLDNAEAEKTDGEFWGFTNNSNARWPIGSTVSFHAYAPHSSADKSQLTYGVDKDNVQTQITYTASTTKEGIINQPDLILATNTGSRQLSDADDAVQLDFYHALTAVSFAIDKDLADVVGKGGKMTSVTLKGIPNKGNCNLSVSATANVPTAAWTMENETGEYTFDLSNANIVVGEKDQALTSDNQTLMMIPQTLPEGAELCFKLDMNGTTQEWKVPLKGQVWEAGKSIIYKLSSNSINMLDDAKVVYPDTWTAHSFPKTSFGENDVVGLYVVNKFNQIVAENVQLTKTKGADNTFAWKTKDNKNFSISTDNKYFFYYPYSSSLQNVNITADTAEDFFKDKIDKLEISSNQKSFEATQLADFQVGKGIFDASGILTAQMKHQVGLAVLHMLGSSNGTVKFYTDSYKYFYGEKGARPVKGQDYYDFATVATYYPSLEFNDNIPYNNGLSAGNTYYSYYFVVPFGKTVKFKAEADPKVTQINNAWGKLQDISLAPTRENPVVKENVECDVPFVKIAHEYYTQKSVHVFETPEVTEYQLECWGSKGQSKNGGVVANAGYSSGFWTATDIKQKLYICCGDMSGYNNGRSKGYNYDAGAWGGGGTHIATGLIGNGETYNYNGKRDQLLLVAGGSGGSAVNGKSSGAGGGNAGANGAGVNFVGHGKAKGGTQTAPGQNSPIDVDVRNDAQFGIGGYTYTYNPGYGSQGGGGYNGGGGGPSAIPGAGGCGYVNTGKLRNGVTQTGVNGPQATGVCRITWTYHRPATLK